MKKTSEMLSLEQVAKLLGVDYRTVYRLVQNGELPAGRIGRVYRIRQNDLDVYFEKQVQSVKKMVIPKAQRPSYSKHECSICGQKIFSDLSIAGTCNVCGGDICAACWAGKKLRCCPYHAEEIIKSAPQKTSAGKTTPNVSTKNLLGESQRKESPTAAIRLDAVNSQGATPLEERIVKLREKEKQPITQMEAKVAETNFVRSFIQKVEFLEMITDPLTGIDIHTPLSRIRYIELPKREESPTEPQNRISRFIFRTGGWGKPKAALMLEAQCFSRLSVLKTQGFDELPLCVEELSEFLERLAQEKKTKPFCSLFRIVLLGSPTGFTNEAITLIDGSNKGNTFNDKHTAVVLWDIKNAKPYYCLQDHRLNCVLPVIDPERWQHRHDEILSGIKDMLSKQKSVTLAQASSHLGADSSEIYHVFIKMKKGGYIMDCLDDMGWILSSQ